MMISRTQGKRNASMATNKLQPDNSTTSEDVSSDSQSSADDDSDLSSGYFEAMMESMETSNSSKKKPAVGKITPTGTGRRTTIPVDETPETADLTASEAGTSSGSEHDERHKTPVANLNGKMKETQITPSVPLQQEDSQTIETIVPLAEAKPWNPKPLSNRAGYKRGIGRSRSSELGLNENGGADVQRLAESMGLPSDFFLKNPSALAPGGMAAGARSGGRPQRRASVVASSSLIDVFEQEPLPMPEAELLSKRRADSLSLSGRGNSRRNERKTRGYDGNSVSARSGSSRLDSMDISRSNKKKKKKKKKGKSTIGRDTRDSSLSSVGSGDLSFDTSASDFWASGRSDDLSISDSPELEESFSNPLPIQHQDNSILDLEPAHAQALDSYRSGNSEVFKAIEVPLAHQAVTYQPPQQRQAFFGLVANMVNLEDGSTESDDGDLSDEGINDAPVFNPRPNSLADALGISVDPSSAAPAVRQQHYHPTGIRVNSNRGNDDNYHGQGEDPVMNGVQAQPGSLAAALGMTLDAPSRSLPVTNGKNLSKALVPQAKSSSESVPVQEMSSDDSSSVDEDFFETFHPQFGALADSAGMMVDHSSAVAPVRSQSQVAIKTGCVLPQAGSLADALGMAVSPSSAALYGQISDAATRDITHSSERTDQFILRTTGNLEDALGLGSLLQLARDPSSSFSEDHDQGSASQTSYGSDSNSSSEEGEHEMARFAPQAGSLAEALGLAVDPSSRAPPVRQARKSRGLNDHQAELSNIPQGGAPPRFVPVAGSLAAALGFTVDQSIASPRERQDMAAIYQSTSPREDRGIRGGDNDFVRFAPQAGSLAEALGLSVDPSSRAPPVRSLQVRGATNGHSMLDESESSRRTDTSDDSDVDEPNIFDQKAGSLAEALGFPIKPYLSSANATRDSNIPHHQLRTNHIGIRSGGGVTSAAHVHFAPQTGSLADALGLSIDPPTRVPPVRQAVSIPAMDQSERSMDSTDDSGTSSDYDTPVGYAAQPGSLASALGMRIDPSTRAPAVRYGSGSGRDRETFRSTSRWEGPLSGYFFGTGSKGTGYYLDVDAMREDRIDAAVLRAVSGYDEKISVAQLEVQPQSGSLAAALGMRIDSSSSAPPIRALDASKSSRSLFDTVMSNAVQAALPSKEGARFENRPVAGSLAAALGMRIDSASGAAAVSSSSTHSQFDQISRSSSVRKDQNMAPLDQSERSMSSTEGSDTTRDDETTIRFSAQPGSLASALGMGVDPSPRAPAVRYNTPRDQGKLRQTSQRMPGNAQPKPGSLAAALGMLMDTSSSAPQTRASSKSPKSLSDMVAINAVHVDLPDRQLRLEHQPAPGSLAAALGMRVDTSRGAPPVNQSVGPRKNLFDAVMVEPTTAALPSSGTTAMPTAKAGSLAAALGMRVAGKDVAMSVGRASIQGSVPRVMTGSLAEALGVGVVTSQAKIQNVVPQQVLPGSLAAALGAQTSISPYKGHSAMVPQQISAVTAQSGSLAAALGAPTAQSPSAGGARHQSALQARPGSLAAALGVPTGPRLHKDVAHLEGSNSGKNLFDGEIAKAALVTMSSASEARSQLHGSRTVQQVKAGSLAAALGPSTGPPRATSENINLGRPSVVLAQPGSLAAALGAPTGPTPFKMDSQPMSVQQVAAGSLAAALGIRVDSPLRTDASSDAAAIRASKTSKSPKSLFDAVMSNAVHAALPGRERRLENQPAPGSLAAALGMRIDAPTEALPARTSVDQSVSPRKNIFDAERMSSVLAKSGSLAAALGAPVDQEEIRMPVVASTSIARRSAPGEKRNLFETVIVGAAEATTKKDVARNPDHKKDAPQQTRKVPASAEANVSNTPVTPDSESPSPPVGVPSGPLLLQASGIDAERMSSVLAKSGSLAAALGAPVDQEEIRMPVVASTSIVRRSAPGEKRNLFETVIVGAAEATTKKDMARNPDHTKDVSQQTRKVSASAERNVASTKVQPPTVAASSMTSPETAAIVQSNTDTKAEKAFASMSGGSKKAGRGKGIFEVVVTERPTESPISSTVQVQEVKSRRRNLFAPIDGSQSQESPVVNEPKSTTEKKNATFSRASVPPALQEGEVKNTGSIFDVAGSKSTEKKKNRRSQTSSNDETQDNVEVGTEPLERGTNMPSFKPQPTTRDEKRADKEKAMARLQKMKAKAIKSANKELGVDESALASLMGLTSEPSITDRPSTVVPSSISRKPKNLLETAVRDVSSGRTSKMQSLAEGDEKDGESAVREIEVNDQDNRGEELNVRGGRTFKPQPVTAEEKRADKHRAMTRLERIKAKAIKSAQIELGMDVNGLASAMGMSSTKSDSKTSKGKKNRPEAPALDEAEQMEFLAESLGLPPSFFGVGQSKSKKAVTQNSDSTPTRRSEETMGFVAMSSNVQTPPSHPDAPLLVKDKALVFEMPAQADTEKDKSMTFEMPVTPAQATTAAVATVTPGTGLRLLNDSGNDTQGSVSTKDASSSAFLEATDKLSLQISSVGSGVDLVMKTLSQTRDDTFRNKDVVEVKSSLQKLTNEMLAVREEITAVKASLLSLESTIAEKDRQSTSAKTLELADAQQTVKKVVTDFEGAIMTKTRSYNEKLSELQQQLNDQAKHVAVKTAEIKKIEAFVADEVIANQLVANRRSEIDDRLIESCKEIQEYRALLLEEINEIKKMKNALEDVRQAYIADHLVAFDDSGRLDTEPVKLGADDSDSMAALTSEAILEIQRKLQLEGERRRSVTAKLKAKRKSQRRAVIDSSVTQDSNVEKFDTAVETMSSNGKNKSAQEKISELDGILGPQYEKSGLLVQEEQESDLVSSIPEPAPACELEKELATGTTPSSVLESERVPDSIRDINVTEEFIRNTASSFEESAERGCEPISLAEFPVVDSDESLILSSKDLPAHLDETDVVNWKMALSRSAVHVDSSGDAFVDASFYPQSDETLLAEAVPVEEKHFIMASQNDEDSAEEANADSVISSSACSAEQLLNPISPDLAADDLAEAAEALVRENRMVSASDDADEKCTEDCVIPSSAGPVELVSEPNATASDDKPRCLFGDSYTETREEIATETIVPENDLAVGLIEVVHASLDTPNDTTALAERAPADKPEVISSQGNDSAENANVPSVIASSAGPEESFSSTTLPDVLLDQSTEAKCAPVEAKPGMITSQEGYDSVNEDSVTPSSARLTEPVSEPTADAPALVSTIEECAPVADTPVMIAFQEDPYSGENARVESVIAPTVGSVDSTTDPTASVATDESQYSKENGENIEIKAEIATETMPQHENPVVTECEKNSARSDEKAFTEGAPMKDNPEADDDAGEKLTEVSAAGTVEPVSCPTFPEALVGDDSTEAEGAPIEAKSVLVASHQDIDEKAVEDCVIPNSAAPVEQLTSPEDLVRDESPESKGVPIEEQPVLVASHQDDDEKSVDDCVIPASAAPVEPLSQPAVTASEEKQRCLYNDIEPENRGEIAIETMDQDNVAEFILAVDESSAPDKKVSARALAEEVPVQEKCKAIFSQEETDPVFDTREPELYAQTDNSVGSIQVPLERNTIESSTQQPCEPVRESNALAPSGCEMNNNETTENKVYHEEFEIKQVEAASKSEQVDVAVMDILDMLNGPDTEDEEASTDTPVVSNKVGDLGSGQEVVSDKENEIGSVNKGSASTDSTVVFNNVNEIGSGKEEVISNKVEEIDSADKRTVSEIQARAAFAARALPHATDDEAADSIPWVIGSVGFVIMCSFASYVAYVGSKPHINGTSVTHEKIPAIPVVLPVHPTDEDLDPEEYKIHPAQHNKTTTISTTISSSNSEDTLITRGETVKEYEAPIMAEGESFANVREDDRIEILDGGEADGGAVSSDESNSSDPSERSLQSESSEDDFHPLPSPNAHLFAPSLSVFHRSMQPPEARAARKAARKKRRKQFIEGLSRILKRELEDDMYM